MSDRRWSDTDRELVREAIHSKFDNVDEQTDAVLDALTAAGWRPTVPTAREIAVATEGAAYAVHALIREHIAEEIAEAIEQYDQTPDPDNPRAERPETARAVLADAAAIARAHRTTPGDDHA